MSKGLVPMPSDQLVASLATRLNSDVSTSACRVHKSCNELASSSPRAIASPSLCCRLARAFCQGSTSSTRGEMREGHEQETRQYLQRLRFALSSASIAATGFLQGGSRAGICWPSNAISTQCGEGKRTEAHRPPNPREWRHEQPERRTPGLPRGRERCSDFPRASPLEHYQE